MSHIPLTSAFKTPAFYSSAAKLCKGSEQAMIYGWRHCGYYQVSHVLDGIHDGPLKKTLNYLAGDPTLAANNDFVTTLEGRNVNLIDYDPTERHLSRKCKAAITDIVLENYKRQKEGLPLIPIIFCIDITDNPQPYSIEKICSKDSKINGQVTHKELRRAYKLCTHPNPKIRAIALQTFKFAKISVDLKVIVVLENEVVVLEQIPAPWAASTESPEKVSSKFAACWEARKKDSKSTPKPNKYDWSKQLEKQVAHYDRVSRLQASMVSQALQTKQRLDTLKLRHV